MSAIIETSAMFGGVLSGALFAFVIFAFVILSVVAKFLRILSGQQPPESRPGGGGLSPKPNQPLNWEEEMKRLLEGRPPLDTTARPPTPPPPLRRVPPPPPVLVKSTRETEIKKASPSREPAALDSLPAPTKPLASLGDATHAYQGAALLSDSVGAQMQRVNDATEKHGKVWHAPAPAPRATNAEARAVVVLLRRPVTARQAVLASLILAPPRALEA